MHAKRRPRSTNGGNRAHLSKRGSAAMLNGRAAFDLFPLAARCCCCGGMCRAPAGLRLKPSTSGDTRSARSATNSVRPDFPMILVEMESSQIDRPCLRSVCFGESCTADCFKCGDGFEVRGRQRKVGAPCMQHLRRRQILKNMLRFCQAALGRTGTRRPDCIDDLQHK